MSTAIHTNLTKQNKSIDQFLLSASQCTVVIQKLVKTALSPKLCQSEQIGSAWSSFVCSIYEISVGALWSVQIYHWAACLRSALAPEGTCDFDLCGPSHDSTAVLQFTGVVSSVVLHHLRNPQTGGVDDHWAPPVFPLTLLEKHIKQQSLFTYKFCVHPSKYQSTLHFSTQMSCLSQTE